MYNYEKNNTQFFFLWEDYLVFFIILLLPVFFLHIYIYLYTLYYFYALVFVGFYSKYFSLLV